jgi:hypothetical protein
LAPCFRDQQLQSGSGADIILVVNNWPQLYAGSVVDVSDVAEEIGNGQGGYYEISKIVANDGQKWIGVPINGMPDRPSMSVSNANSDSISVLRQCGG